MKLFPLIASALALQMAKAKPLDKQSSWEAVNRHLPSTADSKHLRYERSFGNVKREEAPETPDTSVPGYYREGGFSQGNPISSTGKGAQLSGGTDRIVDLQNPSTLGHESTDAGNSSQICRPQRIYPVPSST
jgi:hypothetical protein